MDASQAGEGTLELVVTTTKSSVKADVRARSRGLYDVTFIPQEAVPHFVNITFNDEDVPGSPFKCDIFVMQEVETVKRGAIEPRQVTVKGEGLKEVVLGAPAFFEIDTKGLDGQVDIKITGKTGKAYTYIKTYAFGVLLPKTIYIFLCDRAKRKCYWESDNSFKEWSL